MMELALMPLTSATTMANSGLAPTAPAQRHDGQPQHEGRPAQGSRITEMRPAYCRKYGESMKARAAAVGPGPRRPKIRDR